MSESMIPGIRRISRDGQQFKLVFCQIGHDAFGQVMATLTLFVLDSRDEWLELEEMDINCNEECLRFTYEEEQENMLRSACDRRTAPEDF